MRKHKEKFNPKINNRINNKINNKSSKSNKNNKIINSKECNILIQINKINNNLTVILLNKKNN